MRKSDRAITFIVALGLLILTISVIRAQVPLDQSYINGSLTERAKNIEARLDRIDNLIEAIAIGLVLNLCANVISIKSQHGHRGRG